MTSRRASLNATSVKAVLYTSTDDGRQKVANQVRQLRELAVSRDFEIFREYTNEETGALLAPPAHSRTMRARKVTDRALRDCVAMRSSSARCALLKPRSCFFGRPRRGSIP
jgi:hypothetical protein